MTTGLAPTTWVPRSPDRPGIRRCIQAIGRLVVFPNEIPRSGDRPSVQTSTGRARKWGLPGAPALRRAPLGRAVRGRLSPGAVGRRLLRDRAAALGHLHPRDHEPLDLGRALEQLVDLRVAEPLLERVVGQPRL